MSTFCILFGLLLCCGAKWCEAVEWSGGSPFPFANSASAMRNTISEQLKNPRIQTSWLTGFANAILDNTTTERQHVFYSRLMKRELRKLFCFLLKSAFCQPATGCHPFALYKTNARTRKMAVFFIEKHWMRLDRMVESNKIFLLAIQNTVDSMWYKNWYYHASNDERIKHFWEEVFTPIELYLKFHPEFEHEFADFVTYYEEKNLKIVHDFRKKYINETVLRNTRKLSMALLNDGSPEFLRGFSLFSSYFDKEIEGMIELSLQQLYLKSVPLTYEELSRKDNEERERILIAEAILQLGERESKTREMAQKLFDEAILETANNIDWSNYHTRTRDILFEKLRSKFESAPQFGDKFLQAIKNVKNQMLVMHNTIADYNSFELPF